MGRLRTKTLEIPNQNGQKSLGARERSRTSNHPFTRGALYQLSYAGIMAVRVGLEPNSRGASRLAGGPYP